MSIPCSGAPQQRLINPNSSECPDLRVQYQEEQRIEQEMSSRRPVYTAEDALNEPSVNEAIKRGIIEVKSNRITYNLSVKKSYDWSDPEEWVRARTVAFLIIERGYPANRMRTEVQVPRRTPSDSADIVVYRDDRRRQPYLVVENKAAGQTAADRRQAIEQAFGNANSLRAEYALYDEFTESLWLP